HPDLVYHWGVKAKAFATAGAVDASLLTHPWLIGHLHPDYPLFLPSLYALTARLGGGFAEGPILLWTVALVAATCAAAPAALRAADAPDALARWAPALIALAFVPFGIGYLTAGGADWPLTLALVLALPGLLSDDGDDARAEDARVGYAAALAAACKIEGMALAGLLVAGRLARRVARDRLRAPKRTAASALRVAGPMLLVVALWWQIGDRLALASSARVGAFTPARLGDALTGMVGALGAVNWHGLTYLLLLVPLLAAVRGLRAAALVVLGQLMFYAVVYATVPGDIARYVDTSAARLYLHVMPAALLLVLIAGDRVTRGRGIHSGP
ncbi:MAG: hypothetical protein AAF772_21140, partial [Acidobacteriota bacterium]